MTADRIRKAQSVARKRAAGLVRVEFWVPAEHAAYLRGVVGKIIARLDQPAEG